MYGPATSSSDEDASGDSDDDEDDDGSGNDEPVDTDWVMLQPDVAKPTPAPAPAALPTPKLAKKKGTAVQAEPKVEVLEAVSVVEEPVAEEAATVVAHKPKRSKGAKAQVAPAVLEPTEAKAVPPQEPSSSKRSAVAVPAPVVDEPVVEQPAAAVRGPRGRRGAAPDQTVTVPVAPVEEEVAMPVTPTQSRKSNKRQLKETEATPTLAAAAPSPSSAKKAKAMTPPRAAAAAVSTPGKHVVIALDSSTAIGMSSWLHCAACCACLSF